MIEIASQLGEAALRYARKGLPVFPLQAGGKKPLSEHGFLDATIDEVVIREWWQENPDANIGVPTGLRSGWLVVDIDPRNGGDEVLARLIEEHGPLPATVMQTTGGGGQHYLFRHVQGVRCGVIENGLDRKADGGYIVVPPSVTSGLYSWVGSTAQLQGTFRNLAEAPAWALPSTKPAAFVTPPGGGRIPAGSRNVTLTSLAGTMRRCRMTESAIVAALLEENKTKCDPPLADSEVRAIARSISQYEQGTAAYEWRQPELIQSELPPVQAFSEDLLPDSFCPLLWDVAERMQVPMDYAAAVLVLCLAGVVNRRATIQPKANDTGWVVVPNLWGGIVAPPGFMKSPVIQAATRPLNQIQTEWRKEYKEALKNFAREKEEYDLRRAAWRQQYTAQTKKGKAAPDKPEDEPEELTLRRLIVNDATFEALHQTMSENSAGILVIRDELTGWWSQLDRAGREGERAFCLQAWNGDTGHTIDRIGRGTIHVEACCMSMLGGIQPGRLRSYLVDALKDGPSNDGLIQRFQLLVWPDSPRDWTYVDRPPDAASEEQVARVFRKLVELDEENPERLLFASDAQELFIEWLTELEAKIRGDELHPALISHLSKYRSLMPSLALLFHLADTAAGNGNADTVSLRHTGRAAAWCEYLESHARRVYSCIVTPQLRAAQVLAEKIKRRKVGAEGFFACRDVYSKGWSGLDTPEAVKQAAVVLQDAGWLREAPAEPKPAGGRPPDRYEVNPRVWE